MNNHAESILQSRILVVDDEPVNTALLVQILEGEGYSKLHSTTDPREVEQLHRENQYDLILLDIRMPHMSGFQVMDALVRYMQDDYLPVIVLTAQIDDDTRLQALSKGARDFLTKPFKHWEVLLRIRNMLEARLFFKLQQIRAKALQESASLLERSNRLIRRYVPAQLAQQILAGEYREDSKPQRRKLSIFFSDVQGFTDASDEIDPEELASILNEYLSEMTAIADRYGATVNQLVGDGIMIFFGAPTATDDRDHAVRAVRMALDMQQRMQELRSLWFKRGFQRPFQIRIGINTGFASVGDFGSEGRKLYSGIGVQTNVAARIQAHCEPGKVLISHTTWALVHDEITCADKGEVQFKGVHYPIRVYEVVETLSVAPASASFQPAII